MSPEPVRRKHLRLPEYDYSQAGYYFITVCARGKACIFADVGRGILDAPQITLTRYGKLVEDALVYLHEHTSGVRVDAYVIMPNHIHLILQVENGASGKPRPTGGTIPRFLSSLKRFTNRQAGEKLWQTSYYDHIIRHEADYRRIRQYMDENPARWAEDEYFSG